MSDLGATLSRSASRRVPNGSTYFAPLGSGEPLAAGDDRQWRLSRAITTIPLRAPRSRHPDVRSKESGRESRPMSTTRRSADVIFALAAIILFSPFWMIICLLIKFHDGGPVLFGQERIGRDGRRFRCYKFRSMSPDAEARLNELLSSDATLRAEWEVTHKLKNDPRITPLGDVLRRTSLDELPQLYNILLGDMSIVGPRPIVEAEIERYGRWFGYYTSLTPGLTGLWQVSGRSETSYRQRVAIDRLYARLHSLRSYFLIIFATIPAVLARRGAC